MLHTYYFQLWKLFSKLYVTFSRLCVKQFDYVIHCICVIVFKSKISLHIYVCAPCTHIHTLIHRFPRTMCQPCLCFFPFSLGLLLPTFPPFFLSPFSFLLPSILLFPPYTLFTSLHSPHIQTPITC